MVESAALLLDKVFPEVPIRQWVLSFPFQLRFLLARFPELTSQVLRIVYRAIAAHLIKQAGFTQATAQTGAVTLIQPTLWFSTQSQPAFAYAVSRWCVCRRRQPLHTGHANERRLFSFCEAKSRGFDLGQWSDGFATSLWLRPAAHHSFRFTTGMMPKIVPDDFVEPSVDAQPTTGTSHKKPARGGFFMAGSGRTRIGDLTN
jgi:hypothetical protein